MSTTTKRIPSGALDAVRETEQRLARSETALDPVLAHARNVRAFDDAVKRAGLPVKRTYRDEGLDYQLSRHAVWILGTVETHQEAHPEIARFGPSLVLLVREAERRFAKEERSDELPALIADIATGTPRREVRERFLPPKTKRGLSAVLAAVRSHRIEPARRAFAECDEEERTKLKLLATGLALILGVELVDRTREHGEVNEESQTFASIPEAITEAVRMVS